ncbi:MAG: ParB/Srx family N-terminal domain-containing protein [Candidatus Pacearchaeota archaeon]|jgi:hypothetical protein|nr:ParB/Srx family N-terminal domain-containing protein [Clostridia bacterium]
MKQRIPTLEDFINESSNEIFTSSDIIDLQKNGARPDDTWQSIKSSAKFQKIDNVSISKINWSEKNVDILKKQERRLNRLFDEDDGTQYYKDAIKREQSELQHIQNLIQMVKSNKKLNPIVVDSNYRLLDGFHRIGAYQIAGKKTIDIFKEI